MDTFPLGIPREASGQVGMYPQHVLCWEGPPYDSKPEHAASHTFTRHLTRYRLISLLLYRFI